jgi:hypothetical protein
MKKENLKIHLPQQFRMLCDLLDTSPEEVVQVFICDLVREVGSSGSDERMFAANYFTRCCFGLPIFCYQEQESMLEMLDVIRLKWYEFGNQHTSEYRKEAKNLYIKW